MGSFDSWSIGILEPLELFVGLELLVFSLKRSLTLLLSYRRRDFFKASEFISNTRECY